MTPDPKGRVRAWLATLPTGFIPITAITFNMWLGSSIIAPTLPLYAERMGMSATGVGVVVGAYFLGRMSFNLVGGPIADRWGLRVVAVLGCLVSGISSAIAGLVETSTMLILARIVQGAGAGIYATAALGAIIALSPPERVGRIVSTYQAMGLAGFSLGPVFGGFIGAVFGLEAPFFAFAGLAFLAVALAVVRLPPDLRPREVSKARAAASRDRAVAAGELLPDDAAERARAAMTGRQQLMETLRVLFAMRAFVAALIGTFVVFAMRGGIRNSVVPLFAEAELGMTSVGIGVMIGIASVFNVVLMGHAGRLLDSVGRKPVFLWSIAVTGASVIAVSIVWSGSSLIVTMIVLASATGYASVAPTTIVADAVPIDMRSTAIGIQRVLTDMGHMLGPALAGLAVDRLGYRPGFVVLGGATLLIVLLLVRMPETLAPPSSARSPV